MIRRCWVRKLVTVDDDRQSAKGNSCALFGASQNGPNWWMWETVGEHSGWSVLELAFPAASSKTIEQ
ncbi:carbon-monoxide dehydrogenase small subunit [Anopheles sinensis]|uniref:Carbon-monoxide dehydrogenase small subunit n=1 Tax=Anopheles sinensis TaxID=74873 RepID=A0A084WK93_ANOSI|nr:carbon-monoxide dehydrogenase small subunit [Anopheles sinensis]